MPDLQALLDQIDRLDQEATPGPWRPMGPTHGDHWYVIDDGQHVASIAAHDGENEEQRQPDAELMALARSALPQLAQLGRNLLEIRDNAQQQADDINGGDALDITKLSVLTEVVRSINRAIEHAMETNQ